MSDATRLLEAVAKGDRQAAADLFPLVYNELRRLAAARMIGEACGHTLDATALVHEAYLRLTGDQSFGCRSDFMRAAAEAMRRILVDHARARSASKRGGDRARMPLSDLPAGSLDVDLVDLDEALGELEQHDAVAAELVKLRYFSGFSHQDAAEILGLTRRQADGMWTLARTWLFRRLRPES
jgi:RNA polymerase sigma factor (TIGR02999 family)